MKDQFLFTTDYIKLTKSSSIYDWDLLLGTVGQTEKYITLVSLEKFLSFLTDNHSTAFNFCKSFSAMIIPDIKQHHDKFDNVLAKLLFDGSVKLYLP